ncbi:hypothetical protein K9M16_04795 [Candidatus Babeliales bacterium]|nr:hypothetical protein [Candidatus Babeliales bacterium]
MQTICGISFDKDKAWLGFANVKKRALKPLEEVEIKLLDKQNFILKLKTNIENIERAIVGIEQKYSISVNKIFLELPSTLTEEKEIDEKVVLSKKKKIKPAVIKSAKKYIENKFLEWDQRCIHNIILNYQVKEISSLRAPLGIFTDKIKLKSLLIYTKDSLCKDVAGIFYNIERNFAGFVAHKISVLSQGPNVSKDNQVVVSVNGCKSYTVTKDRKGRINEKKFDFSVDKIIKELSYKYSISPILSYQVLNRYGSFKNIPYFKEVTIKKEDSYLNLSTKALGNFLKKIFANNIKLMIERALENIEEEDKSGVVFSFTGPLTVKDGFYNYVRQLLPYNVDVPADKHQSSSFGCLHYGQFQLLEKNYEKKYSLLDKIKTVYHEYF